MTVSNFFQSTKLPPLSTHGERLVSLERGREFFVLYSFISHMNKTVALVIRKLVSFTNLDGRIFWTFDRTQTSTEIRIKSDLLYVPKFLKLSRFRGLSSTWALKKFLFRSFKLYLEFLIYFVFTYHGMK